jgi:hypothetical protein
MNTIILGLHILAMISSIGLMTSALALGFMGKRRAAVVASVGIVVTFVGAILGAILLMLAPITIECVTLTVYVLSVSALYIFGFGAGAAQKARLIRAKA